MESRLTIACVRCKKRKRRCGGQKPRCANCVTHDAQCEYAAVRRTRGPGKRNEKEQKGDGQEEASGSNTPPRIFPEFLSPGPFEYHLEHIQKSLESTVSTSRFTPLLPAHIANRLIENSFADIMGDHRLLSQVQFPKLLSEQYACSTDGPGETPVRWALVNAVLAMALRFKIAAGAEGDLAHISATFYRNATAVMDRLLLGTPGLLSLQALLAMAMYVRETADKNAFVVLVTNASCQRRLVGAGPKKPTEEMALSWTVLDTFEEEVRLIHEV